MADDTSYGGFTNPGFVTPEQVLQQRQIVQQLLSGAIAPDSAKHWTGVLAQGLMGLRGGNGLAQANQMQRQGLQLGANAGQQAASGNPMANMVYGGQNPTSPQASNSGGSGDNVPRGIRNNNPGNIKDGPFAQSMPGYAGSDGTFARFETPDAGAKAMDSLLATYGNKGINTVSGVVNRWAPPSENNSTAYAATVAKQLGVDPSAPINMGDAAIRQQLAGGITGYENGQRYAPRQQMAQNGGNLAEYYQNPWVPAELKEAVRKGNTPVGVEDVRGRQGYTTTMGGPHLTPQGSVFEQGFRGNLGISADGGVTVPVPFTAPGQGSSNQQGTGNSTGGLAETVAPYAQMGRDLSTQNQFTKAWREPQVAAVTQDQNFLGQYPQIKQALGVIGNDLEQHGANLSMGPQSQTIQNIKKVAANFAPGLFSDAQIEGIAAGDSIHKMSGILGTLLARQIGNSGGTDYSQSLGQGQVPNMENSLQGAKALKSMIEQMTEQQYQLGLAAQKLPANQKMGIDPNFNYVSWKNDWYSKHPIINPITKNPITQDLSKYTTSVNEMQNSGGIKNKTDAEIKEFLKKKGINLGP